MSNNQINELQNLPLPRQFLGLALMAAVAKLGNTLDLTAEDVQAAMDMGFTTEFQENGSITIRLMSRDEVLAQFPDAEQAQHASEDDTNPCDSIEARVRTALSHFTESEAASTLAGDAPFADPLKLDSLDMLEIVMELEEAFEIEISDEEAEKITTINEAVRVVKRKTGCCGQCGNTAAT